jgi:hypothetical protein
VKTDGHNKTTVTEVKPQIRSLTLPQKEKNRMKYSLQKLCLFSFEVQCFDSGQFSGILEGSKPSESDNDCTSIKQHIKNGNYHIIFTPEQITTIENLNSQLADNPYNSTDLFDAIDTLAEALYMPQNSDEMMGDIFVSPIVTMMCLSALFAFGRLHPPKSITGDFIGLQFSICLCIFFIIMKHWHQQKQARVQAHKVGGDWFQ